MASSSACRSSLSQPLTGSGKALIALRQKEVNKSCSRSPVSVSLASASHLRAEVAELCSQASVCTKHRNNTLVSEFWDQTSRDSLSSKTRRSRKASNLVSGSSSSPLPVVTARLFGPAIFEASKLSVLFLGSNKEHPDRLPRIYTLPSITFTLKGWYSKLQRDEVLAEWKRVQGKMSLHVHCHISGGNFLMEKCRIVSKELILR